MNTLNTVFSLIRTNSVVKKAMFGTLPFVTVPIVLLGLSGCITAPFYGQQMNSRTTQVPFTFWTFNKTGSVTVECAKASAHGGPYNGPDSYQLIKTISPNIKGALDSFKSEVFNASTKLDIPNSCWRYYSYPDGTNYITVLRVKQAGSDSSVYTFDKAGLECMGKWNGKSASWTAWLSHSCQKRYSNTGNTIKTVFLKAK